jgi:hypothetical protein
MQVIYPADQLRKQPTGIPLLEVPVCKNVIEQLTTFQGVHFIVSVKKYSNDLVKSLLNQKEAIFLPEAYSMIMPICLSVSITS